MAGCSGKNGTNGTTGSAGTPGSAGPTGAVGSIMPVIQSLSIQGLPAQPKSSVTAMVVAQSSSGLALTYTWTVSSGWTIASGANSSVVTVTSPNSYSTPGVLVITVSDTQGGLANSQVNVQTFSPPPLPAIQSLTAWGLPVSPGTSVIANVVVQSTIGLTLTYSWTVSNGWTISTGGSSSVVTITSPGTYNTTGTATITITDSLGRSVSASISLSTISTIPVINNITAWGMPITPSTSFTATVAASSPAGYPLYYTWTTSTNWTITTGGSSNQVNITPPGAYSITGTATVIVWDAYGESATATIPLVTAQQTLLTNIYPVGISPVGIAIDASGNVWVANNGSGSVSELGPTGTTVGTFTVGNYPQGIAIDASGNVWVVNDGNGSNNVTKLSSSGTTIGTYAVGTYPVGIAIDASGNVWVTNYSSNNVTELFFITQGPQFFPYKGPVFPGGGNL